MKSNEREEERERRRERGRNRVGSVDREVREAVKKCQITGEVVIQNKIVTFMSKLSHTKCRSFRKC